MRFPSPFSFNCIFRCRYFIVHPSGNVGLRRFLRDVSLTHKVCHPSSTHILMSEQSRTWKEKVGGVHKPLISTSEFSDSQCERTQVKTLNLFGTHKEVPEQILALLLLSKISHFQFQIPLFPKSSFFS